MVSHLDRKIPPRTNGVPGKGPCFSEDVRLCCKAVMVMMSPCASLWLLAPKRNLCVYWFTIKDQPEL